MDFIFPILVICVCLLQQFKILKINQPYCKTAIEKQMNKKGRKIKSRNVQTIQANYSIQRVSQKNRSSLSQSKFRTINPDKLQKLNTSLKQSKKKVYITDMPQNMFMSEQSEVRQYQEENNNLQTLTTQQGYYNRTKPSNGYLNNKTMRQSTKINNINKNLNALFQNQLYWNGNNSFLVTGVKNQYQKIKKNYQNKCNQLQKIKRQYKTDTINEMKKYIQKLQKQNARIINNFGKQIRKIQKNKQIRISPMKLLSEKISTEETQIKFYDQCQYQQIEKLKNKNKQLQKKVQKIEKQSKNLARKLFFMEKLIIQKQNSQFRALKQLKKLQKSQKHLQQINKQLQQSLKSKQKQALLTIQMLKLELKKQNDNQRIQFANQQRTKNQKIQRLQKQINHLKAVADHWKSNQNNQVKLYAQNQQNNQTQRYNTKLSLQIQSDKYGVNRKQNSKIRFKNSLQNDLSNNNSSRKYINNLLSQRSLNKSSFKNKNQDVQIQNKQKRQRVTAKTYKSTSIKCRPVQINQIQPIVQYLKLKLAYQDINPSHIKNYFSFQKTKKNSVSILNLQQKDSQQQIKIQKKQVNKQQIAHQQKNIETSQMKRQSQQLETQNNIPWEEQYITLKQVYQVLLEKPFYLQQSQALLLSRFIVQDVKQPFIYMNWDCQNSRRIVQSICSNLLANYQVIKPETKQKSQLLLKKFNSNIIPALKSVSGRLGKVTQDKFFQIFNGLGLERTKYMDQYIIGKMCLHSLNLQELQFSYLYGSQQK